MFRGVSSRASPAFHNCKGLGKRHSHTRRALPYSVDQGLGNFLPPQALRTLEEYQDGLLERLNDELRSDTKAEMHSSVAQIALRYAEKKERTLAFNYAVLAWNNSFFLENLTPPLRTETTVEEAPPEEEETTHQGEVSQQLLLKIRTHYGEFPTLKSTFSAAAMGMFTNGWVWMVTDAQGNLGILPTYGPSTLLIRSRMNMAQKTLIFREYDPSASSDNSNTSTTPTPTPMTTTTTTPPGVSPTSPASGLSSRPFGAFTSTLDPHARANSYARGLEDIMRPKRSVLDRNDIPGDDSKGYDTTLTAAGERLYPLFCLSTYEHAWMSAGYGIWGKEAWIKEFWKVLDWKKISRTYDDISSRSI